MVLFCESWVSCPFSWGLVHGFQALGPRTQVQVPFHKSSVFRSSPFSNYYKVWQEIRTKWQEIITKCGRYWKVWQKIVTKQDRYYQVLQEVIKKCDSITKQDVKTVYKLLERGFWCIWLNCYNKMDQHIRMRII